MSLSRRHLLRNSALVAGAAMLPAWKFNTGGMAGDYTMKLARVWLSGSFDERIWGFDTTHTHFDDGSVEVILWPGELAKLTDTGMKFQILEQDLVARDTELFRQAQSTGSRGLVPTQPGEFGDYRRLADYNADMQMLAAKYPNQARLISMPEQTLEGRTVYGLEIAHNVNASDARPVFYMDGIHHAREWPASEATIMWAFHLLDNPPLDGQNSGLQQRIENVKTNVRCVIFPIINPDGFHYSRENSIQNSTLAAGNGHFGYWRKNRRDVGNSAISGTASTEAAWGVDPNRNYPGGFGGGGTTMFPIDQTYRGTAAGSEPEARNVLHALQTNIPTVVITNHTSGDLILRPYGDTYDNPPDEHILTPLGDLMGDITGYKSQKGIDLYVTTGTMSDHTYLAYGSLGYTFEHAGGGFHERYSTTVPRMYERSAEAFIVAAEAAANPAWHSVIKGRLTDSGGVTAATGKVTLTKNAITEPSDYVTVYEPPVTFTNNSGVFGTINRGVAAPVDALPDYPEMLIRSLDADGNFEIHVPPSTQPKRAQRGETENYMVTIEIGGSTKTFEIPVARGEVVDLGNVKA